ncbi:MAG: hypothetical protein ACLGH4_06115 [Actinomycetes bacterium]
MTSPHRSRRRLPARVYWFRRAMVLSVAVALVVGIAQLLGISSDEPAAEVSAARVGSGTVPSPPVTSPEARAGTEEPRTEDDEKQREPKRKKTRKPLPEPSGPCQPSDVVVTPEVVGRAYAGSPVSIRLNVTTRETPACTYRVSSRSVAVKLMSGTDRIWSSQDCPAAVPEVDVIARKRVPGVAQMQWRGQRSDSACTRTTPWALAGWYHVQAAAFGAEPTSVQFELRPAVAPTITPEPEPGKGKKKTSADGDD